ncbi:MAG TPA: hypothetical protein VH600_16595 [Burkholderiales bacterium]
MPERLAIPGFLRGTRWVAGSGEPSYFVLYETRDQKTITSGAYLDRLNNPTPWSRQMMPHHRNMVRSLCRVRAAFGGGLAQAMATIRFSPPGNDRASLLKLLAKEAMPPLPKRKGLTGAFLLESLATEVPRTEEHEIRGMDAGADCVLLIGGYDADAVRSVVDRDLKEIEGASGLYRCAYSLTPRDLK